MSSIFRDYFRARPDLLKRKKNDEVYALFQQDHPEIPFGEKVRQVCANVKSTERARVKKSRKSQKGLKPAAAAPERAAAGRSRVAADVTALENLEVRIYECLMTAREHDREGLSDVIRHLRQAQAALSTQFV